MKTTNHNAFLRQVMLEIIKMYPLDTDGSYLIRNETIAGYPFTEIWFRTRGCKHDFAGGCTMCNYGRRLPESPENMVKYVRDALSQVIEDPRRLLLVSPSGSMFDNWEVPRTARQQIYELVKEHQWQNFSVETRADSINKHAIREFVETFPGRSLSVEIGLESSDPWIAKYCVNKNLDVDHFQKAIDLLKRHEIYTICNICLGTAFLNTEEAIDDAVKAVNWAFKIGVNTPIIFPIHVKRGTLLEWLWERQLYAPPSLWSLVEVLSRIGYETIQSVSISWFKPYYEDVDVVNRKFLSSPDTCDTCRDKVVDLLMKFQANHDFAIVEKLQSIECSCKDIWLRELTEIPNGKLPERVAEFYELLGRHFFGDQWWHENGQSIQTDVIRSFDETR